MITIHEKAEKITKEHNFKLFKHNGLLCCVSRMAWTGSLNGYVAVPEEHALFGKNYSDKIKLEKQPEFNGNYIGLFCAACNDDHKDNLFSIDLALNVHGGITYSDNELAEIEKDLFGELWWFGFDTMHNGDLKPLQSDIDRKFDTIHNTDEYRDFEYVEAQTRQLADQLIALK